MSDLTTLIIMLVGVIGFMAVCLFGTMQWSQYSCARSAGIMGLQSYWSLSTDCMVKTDHGWYPLGRVWSNGVQQ